MRRKERALESRPGTEFVARNRLKRLSPVKPRVPKGAIASKVEAAARVVAADSLLRRLQVGIVLDDRPYGCAKPARICFAVGAPSSRDVEQLAAFTGVLSLEQRTIQQTFEIRN